MEFDTLLDRYAELLVCHGLNIQPGQMVNLTGELIHRPLLEKLVRKAYQRGAKYVNVDFIDPSHTKERLLHSKEKAYLQYVPPFIPAKFDHFLHSHAAVLRLVGSEDPDFLSDLPPEPLHAVQLAIRQALKTYYQEGVGKSQIHWLVAAAATPKWGKKVFPELSEQEAYEALWKAIFKICHVDRVDFLSLWKTHDQNLKRRAATLTQAKIKRLHFTGPGTDLSVYLSPKALFVGGSSKGPYGEPFEPNIPTEECFTTPDCRLTEGKARITRPFLINGTLIKGLELEFKKGRITRFKAVEGEATFAEYIKSDQGASYLGEVALVGTDSPIFQSGRIFEEILYDENAACHIAIGFAYRFCLEGGATLTDAEVEALGCNVSHVHTDMMISSEEVDVNAETYEGKSLSIIKKGRWVI